MSILSNETHDGLPCNCCGTNNVYKDYLHEDCKQIECKYVCKICGWVVPDNYYLQPPVWIKKE